jgi:heme oxygenase
MEFEKPPHSILRAETARHHALVDASFGKFDLTDVSSYTAFLLAHAKALLPIEARLVSSSGLPAWRPRIRLLEQDLSELGNPLPVGFGVSVPPRSGALYGMLYVIEGSRLGGGVLAERLGIGFPSAYLSDTHRPGEWRMLLAAIDARAAAEPPSWMEDALLGASQAFDLYVEAASKAN